MISISREYYPAIALLLFISGFILGYSIHSCPDASPCITILNTTPKNTTLVKNNTTVNAIPIAPLPENDKLFIDSLLRNDARIGTVLTTLKNYIDKGDPSIIIAADRLNDLSSSAEEELSPMIVSDNLAELKKAYLLSLSSLRKGSLDIVVAANSLMFGEKSDFEYYLGRGSSKMQYAEDTRNYVLNSINFTLNSTKTPTFMLIDFGRNKSQTANVSINITSPGNKICNNTVRYKTNPLYYFDYPCNWSVFTGKTVHIDQQTLTNPLGDTKITIASIPGQFEHTLDDFQKAVLKELQSEKKEIVIKSKNTIKFAGLPAYNVLYSYNDNGSKMTGGDILIRKDKMFYGLIFSFPENTSSKDQKVIESVVNSFTFK